MDQIELECPSCSTMLELDQGFAGGVCRCFNCGTLMTVPANPGVEKAESLSRPDAPGAPGGGRPESPGGGRPESPGAERPDSPAALAETTVEIEAEIDEDESAATGVELDETMSLAEQDLAATTSSLDVYVTASGKRVNVGDVNQVPTASARRKKIKAVAVMMFVGLCLVTAGFLVLIGFVLFGPDDETTNPGDDPAVAGLTLDVNPYTDTEARFMGIDLEETTALVIDGHDLTQSWKETMRELLDKVLERHNSTNQFQVYVYTDSGVSVYPEKWPAKISDERKVELNDMLDGLFTISFGDSAEAVRAAITGRAEQVILVTSHRPEEKELAKYRNALEGDEDLKSFDAVLIDAEAPDLVKLTGEYNGKVMKTTAQALDKWREEKPEKP